MHRFWPSFLMIISTVCVVLALIIALVYHYDLLTSIESVTGLILLLAVTGFIWLSQRFPNSQKSLKEKDRAILVGLALGLLWMIEIGINNFLAPPLPARDIIDNIFWLGIALAMLLFAIIQAFKTGRISQGVNAGFWSGFASGLLACGMALLLVVFGIKWILQDPLNLAEWAKRGASSQAPTMAAYFAYETFAGALSHLIILGMLMGGLLGILGGLVGKGSRALLHFLHPG